ncbi:MAG: cupin domain-containing protein [Spirosomataceae bacterium]
MNIQKILEPISMDTFKTSFFKKKGLFIEGDSKKFQSIFDWNDINNIIDSSILPDKDILLVNSGKFKEYFSKNDLRAEINNGSTLIINKLHQKNQKVGQLAEEVGFFFQEPVQVNMYLGQPNIGGFNLHYDTHDVFVFQIAGNKKWTVYEPTLEFPVFNMKTHGKEKPESEPYLDCTLTAGDFLYLPRGHWHAPIAQNEPSIHLTLGIKSRTGLDFLSWLKDELSEEPIWREELTFNYTSQFKRLKSILEATLNDKELDDKYKNFCKNNLWVQSSLNFPFTLKNQDLEILTNKIVSIRKTINITLTTQEDTITIIFNNNRIRLVKKAERLVQFLLTNEPLKLYNINATEFDLSREQILYLCKTLLQENLLSFENE